MTKKEWVEIVKTLKALYSQFPNYLKDAFDAQVWYEMLKDLQSEIIKGGILTYAATNKMPPTIADIREYATKDYSIEDWSAGWNKVNRAISRYGYVDEQGALESFDEITKETVKRIGWKNICTSEKIEVERASFRIIYEQIVRDETRKAQLSGVAQIGTVETKKLVERQ